MNRELLVSFLAYTVAAIDGGANEVLIAADRTVCMGLRKHAELTALLAEAFAALPAPDGTVRMDIFAHIRTVFANNPETLARTRKLCSEVPEAKFKVLALRAVTAAAEAHRIANKVSDDVIEGYVILLDDLSIEENLFGAACGLVLNAAHLEAWAAGHPSGKLMKIAQFPRGQAITTTQPL